MTNPASGGGIKARLVSGAARARSRYPRSGRLIDRAESASVLAANLLRWARHDPRQALAEVDLAVGLAAPAVEPLLHPGTRTIRRCERPGTPRGVICSMATGPHRRLLSVAAPTLFDYGERHGWDVVLSTEEDLAGDRPASWGKLPLIQSLLDDYELVWWVDADALIVDHDRDLRSDLVPDRDLYLVEHLFATPSTFAASAGVMVWRSSEWSRELIEKLWANERYAHEYPWENAALLEALGWEVSPAFVHLRPTKLMERVGLLPNAWNSVWLDPAPRPVVHHHGGNTTVEQRRRFMLGDLARVRAGLPPQMSCPEGSAPPRPRRGYLRPGLEASRIWRDELPFLLNERGLTGVGVEVGVYAGEFSARLLTLWEGEKLISVDPWRHGDDYDDISNLDPDGFEQLWLTTCRRLERFGPRSEIWRATGDEAATRFEDGTLDFVYLDARHDEGSVAADLRTWFPKVRPGGIFAGHDYLDGRRPEGLFGVKTAVDRFFGGVGLPVHVTGEPMFPSWIVEVPAVPEVDA